MPNNEDNFISPGSLAPFYPKTTTRVTHSFGERLLTAEFDDALCDQAAWKNSRYDGAKLIAKKVNEYTPTDSNINTTLTSSGDYLGQNVGLGISSSITDEEIKVWGGDISYQNLPVLTNKTTALYIANTVIGGMENEKFARIKNHSYVGINKILITDPDNDTVQVIDATTEPFEEFHRFITNDFPTGNRLIMKILEEEAGSAVPNNLKGFHRVRMNKGYLLRAFKYRWAGEYSGSAEHDSHVLTHNNSMYLYKGGDVKDNYFHTGSAGSPVNEYTLNQALRFRYAVHELFNFSNPGDGSNLGGAGPRFDLRDCGPSFASSSIFPNKFTQAYYSGSFGFIQDKPTGTTNAELLNSSGVGSASRFMAVDSLNHLKENIESTTLTQQEKTEIHVTFFQGTKDFAPEHHDERSIGTFEIDQQQGQLSIEQGDACAGGVPTTHELVFKAAGDFRFMPKTGTFTDTIQSAHVQTTASVTQSNSDGCVPPGTGITNIAQHLEPGVNIDRVENFDCYVQGGALGEIGYEAVWSASGFGGGNDYGNSQIENMTVDNMYSGSFSYEFSFLDKNHTLIIDCDKETELENGIGNLGLLLIPENLVPDVAFNLNYWLDKAGIIPSVGNNTPNINNNVNPNTSTQGLIT